MSPAIMNAQNTPKTNNESLPKPFQSTPPPGIENRRDAITNDPKVNAKPLIPATPNPGITKISAAMNINPVTNKMTSSQPDVPPKKRLQKNRPKHSTLTKSPTPKPGAPSSTAKATKPSNSNRKVTNLLLRINTSVSTQLRDISGIGVFTLSTRAKSSLPETT